MSLKSISLAILASTVSTMVFADTKLADVSELYEGKEFQRAFTNPKDNPYLPRVLLIGDSISIGYTVPVRKVLVGKVNVHRIPGNGQTAANGVEKLESWIGKGNWDVIHFNWGLWDLCHRNPESSNQGHRDKVNGKPMATLEEYRKNLEAAVAILKKTNAKLIWCATTPVPEGEQGRILGDDIRYNNVAEEIMKANGIMINDLYSHALKATEEIHIKPGDVHFNAKGNDHLATKVADSILAALETDQQK